MKRADLKAKQDELKDSPDEFINYIMSENGKDINSYREQVENANAKYSEYEEKIKAYEDTASKYKDYDELIKFKTDTLANQDKKRKIEWIKSQGAKHPELLLDKFDFENSKWDDKEKTYTGLDKNIEDLKTNYADLFEGVEKKPQVINPNEGKASNDQLDGVTKASMSRYPYLYKK